MISRLALAKIALIPAVAALLAGGATLASATATPTSHRTPASAVASTVGGHPKAVHTAHRKVVRHTTPRRVVKHTVVKHAVKHTVVKHTAGTTPAPVTPGAAAPTGGTPVRAASAGTSQARVSVSLSPFETRMLQLVNQARTSQGLHALVPTAGTTDVARRWSLQLAQNDALSHNPDLADDISSAGSPSWTFIAENVGTGPADEPDVLFAAYMASPHHRDNILDPRAVDIGMGTIETTEPDGDTAWNTMDFVDSYNQTYGPTRTQAVDSVTPLSQLG